jgi:hypothetical protein
MRAGRAGFAGLILAACCVPLPATPARAAATPLATLPSGAARLTAYDGYIVFSDRSAQGTWSLMAWHAGRFLSLPVPARTIPFDAEAGPGPDGRPTVVFSKCAREPLARAESPPHALVRPPLAADVEWQTASGCRIYELALAGGAPRLVANVRPGRGRFDATPAIWHRELAFARYGGSGPPQLLLAEGRRLTRLGGGPASCPTPSTIGGVPLCGHGERLVRAHVAGVSLSAGAAVYEWVAEVPGAFVGPSADPEIRIDPLRGARQSAPTKLLAMSVASAACGGASSGSANAAGGEALYVTSEFACEPAPERRTSRFELGPPVGRGRSIGTGAHVLALAVAWDRGTAYWIGLLPSPEAQCTTSHTCEREEAKRAAECPAQSVCDSARPLSEPFSCEPGEGVCTLMRTSGLAGPSATSAGARSRATPPRGASRPHAARH